MDALRRILLKGAGATGAVAAAIAAGVLRPSQALAAEYNRAAFEAKDLAGALKGIGADSASENSGVAIKAPDIAENGAVVPIDVSSTLPNTISLSVLVDKNPSPLTADFVFSNGALPQVALRVKMGQTSLVEAVAKTADGKYFVSRKEVKVTVGGCGG